MSSLVDYLQTQREAVGRLVQPVRQGDVEAVHDMRVAVRRLRATLRTFGPLLNTERTEPLRAELGWLGDLLGEARDPDVIAARLDAAVAREAPELIVGPVANRIQQRLAAVSARAHADLDEGLDSPRYAGMTDLIDEVLAGIAPTNGRRLHARVRRALLRADRILAGAVDSLSTCDNDAAVKLHHARRAYKRARYAVEVLVPAGPPEAGRLVNRLRDVQDLLGEFQDSIVTEGLLREYGMLAHLDRENAFTYGLLYGRQRPGGRWRVPGLSRARRRAGRPRLRRWLG
jgi:CHAD domain-containing protein